VGALTLPGASPLASSRRVVLKVGSALLIGADGDAAQDWLDALAADAATFRRGGRQVIVVTSGAVALGRRVLGLPGKLNLEEKQAAAAAGQTRLMRAWEAAFAPHALPVAQALLTPEDTERRRRWLNARATLETLLRHHAVPVINENDTVATQELRYGDNDRLAARVAQMISADALILLSDVDGLYDRDPRVHGDARRIPEVRAITPEIEAMAGGTNAAAGVGSGGMRTKIEAARIATGAGCAVAITSGAEPQPFTRLMGDGPATWFLPARAPKAAYKAWIAGALDPQGALVVDAGAARALSSGKSLLAAGVTDVRGRFEKGDAVRLLLTDGQEVGRGIARYDDAEARRIKGLRSDAIEGALGYDGGAVLVHADDLAVLADETS
ncbi:MAG: glutamate 5-kinase, partial [Hyphomonadaceae bacterium]|nr:glutamate 5-kinase [Hyphomonadaceae bacterium]